MVQANQYGLCSRATNVAECRTGALENRQGAASLRRFFVCGLLAFIGVTFFTAAHAAKRPPRDTKPPTVSITSPSAGSTVNGVVAVVVSASDNVGVAKVNLLVNGTVVATTTTIPYSFNWDSTKTPNGSVTLSAAAYDSAGNSASKGETVTVSNNTQPPSVGISSPAPGSTLKGTVAVNISASSALAIARVDLKANGVLAASATTAPYAFGWDTTTIPDGSVILSAWAYDAAGNSAVASANETIANATGSTSSATTAIAVLSTTSIAFGTQKVLSTSLQRKVALKNGGGNTLTISALTAGGSDLSDFVFSGTCGLNTSLTAGQSCDIVYAFAPTTANAGSATLAVATNAGRVALTLTGTGTLQ